MLTWIRTCSKKFKPFVSVTIAEIQETLETQAFQYIRSDCNPSGVLTRAGRKDLHFRGSLKKSGPSFKKIQSKTMKNHQMR